MRKSLDPTQTTFTSCMHDQMLESNRDDVKLEAMRCVTVMTAKGKLSVPRTLFPHIVKNVSSKNPELKKLIYLYLSNFADQEQDLALLPVASLQKSLKSPNPLVRSSALKVLTSMRLSILTAILMATLRNSVNDLSPYVRKTVAHSIIKIYRLEPTLRNDMIEYIERLFNDKNSMVLSSAVASFEVVCPEKLDLVHKHYRRFCFILADCNEWGQTLMLKLLLRYVIRTYNRISSGKGNIEYNPSEHDPKILLRSAKPLVHSNNSAVVMAVVKLYIAIANQNEARSTITRPLIRLLYTHREIQLTVLNMIEDLTSSSSSSLGVEEDKSDSDGSEIGEPPKEQPETNLKEDLIEKIDSTEDKSEDGKAVEAVPEVNKDEYEEVGGITNEESSETKEEGEQEEVTKEDGAKHEVADEVEQEEEEEEEEEDDDDDDEDDETEEEDEDDEDESSEEEEEDSDEDEIVETVENNIKGKNGNDKASFDLDFIDFKGNKDPQAYKEMFRPYLKSFFIKHTDCTQVRLAKLKILTNLSSSVNVTQILRELQAYISTYVDDKEFVSAAIHTIGRCAILVKEVAHTCLNRLTSLLSNNNEHIVSNAIVVLRSQIINKKPSELLSSAVVKPTVGLDKNGQSSANEKAELVSDRDGGDRINSDDSSDEDDKIVSTVIKQVTKLLPTVTAPQARATILWILAEFCDKNLTAAKCTPNVLRSIAKSFCQEDNFVKLQSLTLASKFLLSLDKDKKAELYHKVNLLTGYLFSLAKYDINHDVRDRGRFLKKLLDEEILCSKVLNGIKSDQFSNIY